MMEIDKQGENLKQLARCLSEFVSHNEIDDFLLRCGFEDISRKKQKSLYGFLPGDNKMDRIYNNFANELNKSQNDKRVISFIESVMTPSRYVNNQLEFESRLVKLNKILLFMGCRITNSGKVVYDKKADTIDEVYDRIKNLQEELNRRKINAKVLKYCSREFLAKDYFHACFEAVKGIYDRIREFTGIENLDGQNLIEKVFKVTSPMITINSHSNDSDINEFKGLGNLILSLHQMVRNPDAHIVRIKNETELDECLEILTMVSRVHNYLDIAQRTCFN